MRVERAPYVDEYVEGDRSVVMLPDGGVLALAPIVTTILGILDAGPMTVDELGYAVVQTFIKPGIIENTQDIEATVRFMLTEGLVQERPV